MSKRKYTHVQELEGEILAMRKEGATRQEIADQLGLSKSQIKNWINRYNRRRNWKQGSCRDPRGGLGKMRCQAMWSESRRMRLNGYGWRTNYCGIFCDLQEGSEAECKICSNPPA